MIATIKLYLISIGDLLVKGQSGHVQVLVFGMRPGMAVNRLHSSSIVAGTARGESGETEFAGVDHGTCCATGIGSAYAKRGLLSAPSGLLRFLLGS